MTLENAVMAFAGVMVLVSAALVYFFGPWWLLFTAFIGLNMLQSAFSKACPAIWAFRKMGFKPAGA